MNVSCDSSPVLLVDTREKRPLRFSHLPAESATLTTGDYSVKGLEEVFAVERKSLVDLAGSLTRERERFMRELHRLRGFSCPYLLIVGDDMELYRLEAQGRLNMKQVEHSLNAIQTRYRVHVGRAECEEQAARMVETWAFSAWREALKPAGMVVPFPDWVIGLLCPRAGRCVTAADVLNEIERETM